MKRLYFTVGPFQKASVAVVILFLFLCVSATAAMSWQEALARMPLAESPPELDRSNCVRVMLHSFQPDEVVKALIFLPGATDEFYFFRRARARLTNASPTLLDAVASLTNQTYLRATFYPPLLLLHTAEDPITPIIRVEHEPTADRLRKRRFLKQFLWNDRDWNFVQPLLSFELDTRILPGPKTHESNHLFRHSLAAYGLNAWEALEAISLVNKTQIVIQKKKLLFELDERVMARPPVPDNWISPGQLKR